MHLNGLKTQCRLRLCSFHTRLVHGFADMPFHVMSAHVAAADISVTKGAVKAVRVSTHFADIRIMHLHPCWVKFRPVEGSAIHLGLLGRSRFLTVGVAFCHRTCVFVRMNRSNLPGYIHVCTSLVPRLHSGMGTTIIRSNFTVIARWRKRRASLLY